MSTHLAEALVALRAAVGDASYPLALPEAADARDVRAALLGQLDDYLLPRLARFGDRSGSQRGVRRAEPDWSTAPLLVIVGGSTGAGKSTLINSLVEAPVSAAGVLRPTTRAPVLVSHPNDAQWFRRSHLLPGLARTSAAPRTPSSLQLVAAPALTPGLALLDAPDIDSVVDSNRALAGQLLAAADLWLFLTTATRYADAVPWGLLATARERGTAIALVLDRVPPDAAGEVTAHFTEMLAGHGFGGAPLFVVPEVAVGGQGLLPSRVVTPLRDWLAGLARDAGARSAVVRQTVAGAVAAAGRQVAGLATAVDDQVACLQTLTERVRSAYRAGLSTVDEGVREGTLLRGEVLARWQEFVGTGEWFSALTARIGRLRDQITAALVGRMAPGRELKAALESSLAALIAGAAADAAEQAASAWRAHPAGAALLADARLGDARLGDARLGDARLGDARLGDARPVDLARPDDLDWRAQRLVRDWQREVLRTVRAEAGSKRSTARSAAYAANATGLLVMVGVFASTAFIPTGAEVAVAGGTTVAAQKVLAAVFSDQTIRALATKAREDLMDRVKALLDDGSQAFLDRLPRLDEELAARLRSAADVVADTAAEAELTPPEVPALAALLPEEPTVDAEPAAELVVDAEPAMELVVDAERGAEPAVDDRPAPEPAVDDRPAPELAVDDRPAPELAVDNEPQPVSPAKGRAP